MKTYTILIALLLLLCSFGSCGKKEDKKESPPISVEPEPVHDPLPGPQPDPVPVEPDPGPDPDPVDPIPEPEPEPEPQPAPIDPAKTFKTSIKFFGSMATQARMSKYLRGACVVRKVVALDSFKQKILSYDSPYTTNTFFDTEKVNSQVYQSIIDGAETLQPTKDNEMDVEIEFYYANTSVIGYTYPSSKRIWVNTKYFDTYTPKSVASNLMHEYLHKLGYKHASSYSASRDHSVPYAVGYMVRTLGGSFESACP